MRKRFVLPLHIHCPKGLGRLSCSKAIQGRRGGSLETRPKTTVFLSPVHESLDCWKVADNELAITLSEKCMVS